MEEEEEEEEEADLELTQSEGSVYMFIRLSNILLTIRSLYLHFIHYIELIDADCNILYLSICYLVIT